MQRKLEAMACVSLVWLIPPFSRPAPWRRRYWSWKKTNASILPSFPSSSSLNHSYMFGNHLLSCCKELLARAKMEEGRCWKRAFHWKCVPQTHPQKYGFLFVQGSHCLPAVRKCHANFRIRCKWPTGAVKEGWRPLRLGREGGRGVLFPWWLCTFKLDGQGYSDHARKLWVHAKDAGGDHPQRRGGAPRLLSSSPTIRTQG